MCVCTFFLCICLTCPEEAVTIPNLERSWPERQKGVAAERVSPYVCVCVGMGVCAHAGVCLGMRVCTKAISSSVS